MLGQHASVAHLRLGSGFDTRRRSRVGILRGLLKALPPIWRYDAFVNIAQFRSSGDNNLLS